MKEIEVPYELPEGWAWTNLGDIGIWQSGATPKRSNEAYYINGSIPWLLTGDLNDGLIENVPNKITELALKESSVKLNPSGSILIAMYGATIGKLGILTFPSTTNQACCACQPFKEIKTDYLFYFLMAHKKRFIDMAEGGAQPNISRQKIITTKFSVPPFNEQRLIVEEIRRYFSLIDIIETEQESLNQLSEQLKKKVLEAAMQGKLVPQDPSDEPASVLLGKIRAEKQRLYEAGKLKKKDLQESIIYKGDDNSYYQMLRNKEVKINPPYQIPDSWQWRYLADVIQLTSGRDLKKSQYNNEAKGVPYITGASNFQNGTIHTDRYTTEPQSLSNKTDLLISVKGTIGEMAFNPFFQSHIARQIMALQHLGLDLMYVRYYLESTLESLQNQAQSMIPGISRDVLLRSLIPIPPQEEVERIIKRISLIKSTNL